MVNHLARKIKFRAAFGQGLPLGNLKGMRGATAIHPARHLLAWIKTAITWPGVSTFWQTLNFLLHPKNHWKCWKRDWNFYLQFLEYVNGIPEKTFHRLDEQALAHGYESYRSYMILRSYGKPATQWSQPYQRVCQLGRRFRQEEIKRNWEASRLKANAPQVVFQKPSARL